MAIVSLHSSIAKREVKIMKDDNIFIDKYDFPALCNSICKDEVNIFHISDLHFGIEKSDKKEFKINAERQAKTIKSLIKTLKDDLRVPQNWKPDVVVISGDIGWTGSSEEYEKYKSLFLQPLLEEFDNLSQEKIITCPGNHDIIRENAEDFERPHSNHKIEIKDITRESIGEKRKKHFQNYVDYFCAGDSQKLVSSLKFEEWPWLRFLILNSAWDCRDEKDEGVLRVGLELLEEITNDVDSENEIVIALFHHPHTEVADYDIDKHINVKRNWLHISEREPEREGDRCFSVYIDEIADFILNGHIHVKTRPLHSRTGKSIQLISGTAFSNDSLQYHCRILKVRCEGEPLYIDIENSLTNSNYLWDTSSPKNFRVFGSVINRQKRNLEQIRSQRLELLAYQKALQEWKIDKSSENLIQALIRLMNALYPAIQIDNKLENQPITDELADEIINRINILQLKGPR